MSKPIKSDRNTGDFFFFVFGYKTIWIIWNKTKKRGVEGETESVNGLVRGPDPI